QSRDDLGHPIFGWLAINRGPINRRAPGGQSDLGKSLGLSLLISLTVASIATISGFFTSKWIAQSTNRSNWLLIAYFPYVLSPVIYAACVYYYFIVLGLSGNVWGVMLGQTMIAFPFAVILFGEYWNARLQSMEHLVYTLGGNARQALWQILIPLSKGMLLVCFFQTFLISWFEYGLTTLLGVGKVQTLTVRVFVYINEANPFLAAMAGVLLCVPPLILLWINKRFVFQPQSS
ncbi:MAG: hypothetical protein AAF206_29925, partial [Bacteroidota bacterium]